MADLAEDIAALRAELAKAQTKQTEAEEQQAEATAKFEEWAKAAETAAFGSDEAKEAEKQQKYWKEREDFCKEKVTFFAEKVAFCVERVRDLSLEKRKTEHGGEGPEVKRLFTVSDVLKELLSAGRQDMPKTEAEPLRTATATNYPARSPTAKIRRDPADVIRDTLNELTFSSTSEVLAMLKDHNYIKRCTPLKRDLETGAPSLLLDALDKRVAEFGVSLGALEERSDPYEMVLLAPSGAGKTRKILQYLANDTNMGYFVPYKTNYDEKPGSRALATVLAAVNISETQLSMRRERIEFGVNCVLLAFQAVKVAWLERASKHSRDSDRQSAAWLLMQLYPVQVLGYDVFEKLALELFERCEGARFRHISPCACFIDEAHAILLLGESVVPSVEQPGSLRSAISAVLSGVSNCMGVIGIVAGTGESLAREFITFRSQMGVESSCTWAYLEFPPLEPAQIRRILQLRLDLDDSDPVLGMAASWLAGRPRWTSTFIEQLISEQQLLTVERLQEYIKSQTAPVTVFNTSGSPRSPAELFAKLRTLAPVSPMPIVSSSHVAQEIPSPHLPNRAVNDDWADALHQAFLLTVGSSPQKVENVVLADLDIGYIRSVLRSGIVEVKIELEPLVLESAWRHIKATQPNYTVDLLAQVGDSESAMADQFKYVVADRVLPHLVPSGRAFETSVFLTHDRHGAWRRFLDPKESGSTADIARLAKAFEGTWERDESSLGRVALQEPGTKKGESKVHQEVYKWLLQEPGTKEGESKVHQEVYKWLQRFASGRQPGRPTVIAEPTPSIFFPEPAAGPDILMVVHRPDDKSQIMLVSVQVELTKGTLMDGSLSGTDTSDALFTVDPAKFYMENRTATGGTPVGDLAARITFLDALANVPVIRVLVSGAATVSKAETGLVRHGRANAKYKFDLQVVVDQKDMLMDEVLGRETVNRIMGLRGLSGKIRA